MRRVLLSSIEGAAVTNIKFAQSQHEFSTLPGVVEDVTEIILNIKKLVLRLHSKTPKTIVLKKDKKGTLTAADIQTEETVEVVNKDLHIATLTKDAKFQLEMEVARGRGYVSAELNKKEDQPIGVIAIDSIFNPVTKVAFSTENTRVGQRTDYDRLLLEITTNGSLGPKDALLYASNILQRHLDVFVNFGKLPEEEMEDEPEMHPDEIALYEKLRLPISELELSVRSSNCFREENIKIIADLVKHTEEQMLELRNFGKKSLAEVKQLIAGLGLSLGMKIDSKRLKQK